jgi:hypothetical protein
MRISAREAFISEIQNINANLFRVIPFLFFRDTLSIHLYPIANKGKVRMPICIYVIDKMEKKSNEGEYILAPRRSTGLPVGRAHMRRSSRLFVQPYFIFCIHN